jgi:hypothetical protein
LLQHVLRLRYLEIQKIIAVVVIRPNPDDKVKWQC